MVLSLHVTEAILRSHNLPESFNKYGLTDCRSCGMLDAGMGHMQEHTAASPEPAAALGLGPGHPEAATPGRPPASTERAYVNAAPANANCNCNDTGMRTSTGPQVHISRTGVAEGELLRGFKPPGRPPVPAGSASPLGVRWPPSPPQLSSLILVHEPFWHSFRVSL